MTRITDLILFVIVCAGLVLVVTSVLRAGTSFIESRSIDVPAMVAKYKSPSTTPVQHPRLVAQAVVK